MKILKHEDAVKKYQQGGAMAQQQANAPAQGGEEQDPLVQLAEVFVQGLQNQDCNMLAKGAQLYLQLIQQMSNEQQAPVGEQPQGEPVFKKGGKMIKKVAKKCGK